ncbi:MAG: MFS transporter [Acidimicrobiia bacterium]
MSTVPPLLPGSSDRAGVHVRLFGSRMFFRLWVAQVVSALGDWLGFLAITLLAVDLGGGSGGAAVSLVMTARILPGFFLAPVAGVMIDRWDRKKVMVSCDLVRAGVICALPFVGTVGGLVVASLVLEVCTLLWSPAKEASVPNLVPADRLTSANSLSLAAAYGTFPVAAVVFALLAQASKTLGGLDILSFLETDQVALAFYVDAVTFVTSALLISRLHLSPNTRRGRSGDEGAADSRRRVDLTGTLTEFREGWQYIFVNPVVRSVNLGLATGLIGGGMVVPLGSIFSLQVLGAGAAGYGLFTTALGFGVAAGVLLLSLIQNRLPKARAFELALFGCGGCLIFAAAMSALALSLIGVFGLGVCGGAVYVLGFTLLHESVDDQLRGRIFSALYTLVRMCLLISFTLGPLLAEVFDRLSNRLFSEATIRFPGGSLYLPGVRITLWLAGAIMLVAGVVAVRSLRAGPRPTKDEAGAEAEAP